MKKILGVSLVALMAVSTARADIVSKSYVDVDQSKTYNVITKTAKTGVQIEELDAKMGALPSDKTIAEAISEAVSGGTANVVTHSGAVGTATQPVYITSEGVATAGTALGTMAYEAAANYTPTSDLGTLATKSSIGNADVAADAAIADSKIAATGSIASGNGGLVTGGTVYTALQDYTPTANLDSSVSATAGQVVTAISMADGALSTTTADPLSVTSYSVGHDGKYALTAVVSGGAITGYKWELITRDGTETEPVSGY